MHDLSTSTKDNFMYGRTSTEFFAAPVTSEPRNSILSTPPFQKARQEAELRSKIKAEIKSLAGGRANGKRSLLHPDYVGQWLSVNDTATPLPAMLDQALQLNRAGTPEAYQAKLTEILSYLENTFILDPGKSTLDLLERDYALKYKSFKWGPNDFPKGEKSPSPHNENELVAEAMFSALAALHPERRPNQGETAVITLQDFKVAGMNGRWKGFIKNQLNYPRDNSNKKFQLNKHAIFSFNQMYDAAAKDGVFLKISSAYRPFKKKECRNPSAVACGLSSHELGLAIDFALSFKGTGTGNKLIDLKYIEVSTKNFSTNFIKMYRSPVHKWMFLKGYRYGWFPYKKEPWHFEYNPLPPLPFEPNNQKTFREKIWEDFENYKKPPKPIPPEWTYFPPKLRPKPDIKDPLMEYEMSPASDDWYTRMIGKLMKMPFWASKGPILPFHLMALYQKGEKDPNKLTDRLFHDILYPERNGRQLDKKRDDPVLFDYWKALYTYLVVPFFWSIGRAVVTLKDNLLLPGNTGQPMLLEKNKYGLVLFPESGRGFARYTIGHKPDEYAHPKTRKIGQWGDSWILPQTGADFYNAIQEFRSTPEGQNVIIHYGDVSAMNPGINLGHETHFRGKSIDIHYIGSRGEEVTGDNAYKNADVTKMNKFFEIVQRYGFKKNFSKGNRFTHTGSNNDGDHGDHFHISQER
jgi:D-alanyl-D-alanine dipeptidase